MKNWKTILELTIVIILISTIITLFVFGMKYIVELIFTQSATGGIIFR